MVSNSAKLDRRTKQHTQFGVSASNGSRDMARTKSWRKKKKKKKNNEANWMVSNSAKLDSRTKQHTQSGVSMSAWKYMVQRKTPSDSSRTQCPTGRQFLQALETG